MAKPTGTSGVRSLGNIVNLKRRHCHAFELVLRNWCDGVAGRPGCRHGVLGAATPPHKGRPPHKGNTRESGASSSRNSGPPIGSWPRRTTTTTGIGPRPPTKSIRPSKTWPINTRRAESGQTPGNGGNHGSGTHEPNKAAQSGKEHEPQGNSDSQLREAHEILKTVLGQINATKHPKAAGHIKEAIHEIRLALKMK